MGGSYGMLSSDCLYSLLASDAKHLCALPGSSFRIALHEN